MSKTKNYILGRRSVRLILVYGISPDDMIIVKKQFRDNGFTGPEEEGHEEKGCALYPLI